MLHTILIHCTMDMGVDVGSMSQCGQWIVHCLELFLSLLLPLVLLLLGTNLCLFSS